MSRHACETHQGRGCCGVVDFDEESCEEVIGSEQEQLQQAPYQSGSLPSVTPSPEQRAASTAVPEDAPVDEEPESELDLFDQVHRELSDMMIQRRREQQSSLAPPDLEQEVMAFLLTRLSGVYSGKLALTTVWD